jgi:hypothetical protein
MALALAAFLVVMLAPSGAAAHGGAPHAHAAKLAADTAVVKDSAVTVELRARAPLSADDRAATDCGDRGCCSAGHCSGCGTALAPASWACLPRPTDAILLNPDAMPPPGLALEGPPRPPKSFV